MPFWIWCSFRAKKWCATHRSEKWLGRTGVDMNVLISNLRQSGAVRLFATTLRGEHGSTTQVEISAVSVSGGELPCLGFTIRDVGRRLSNDPRASRTSPGLPAR